MENKKPLLVRRSGFNCDYLFLMGEHVYKRNPFEKIVLITAFWLCRF